MAIDRKTTERAQAKRRHFGVPASRLSVSKEIPGYHLRWVNDEPGRLELAQESGYTFVNAEEIGRVPRTGEDQRIRELVGVQRDEKTAMYAYLMKTPEEFYREDRAALDEQVDKIDEAILRGKIEDGEGRYIPSQGISYKK